MDKPFGILVIVLAMFVTLGALAAGLMPPAGSQAMPEKARVNSERAVPKTPGDNPVTQAPVTRSLDEAANSESERPKP